MIWLVLCTFNILFLFPYVQNLIQHSPSRQFLATSAACVMQSLARFDQREEALESKILQETATGLEYLTCDTWTSSSGNKELFSSLV